jgi:hypothetical protein
VNAIRSHTRTIVAIPLLATLSLAGSTLILPSGVLAASDAGDASATHKVFVCKYVGTPGVNERLKAGQNPISVDLHAIDEYRTFDGDIDSLVGGHFADAQGRSFVIAVDRGQPEPPVTVCPSPDAGETPTATPTASPIETPTASPNETPTDSPSDAPGDTEPNATPTPDPVTTPTSASGGDVQVVAVTPQVTPPSTDTASAIQGDHEGNLAPVLLLLAALTGVFALATPHARGKARRGR